MSFTISDYDELKTKYSAAILRLNGNHKVDSQDELPSTRRMQVEFLDKIRDELDQCKYADQDKSLIFSGAMLVVRYTISDEYKYTSPENSNLYNHLAKLLHIQGNAPLAPNDVYKLVHPALNFIKELTFVDGEIEKGVKKEHAFVGIEKQFKAIWTVCSGLVKSASDEIVNNGFVMQEQQDEEKEQESDIPEQAIEKPQKPGVIPGDLPKKVAPAAISLFNQGAKNSNASKPEPLAPKPHVCGRR